MLPRQAIYCFRLLGWFLYISHRKIVSKSGRGTPTAGLTNSLVFIQWACKCAPAPPLYNIILNSPLLQKCSGPELSPLQYYSSYKQSHLVDLSSCLYSSIAGLNSPLHSTLAGTKSPLYSCLASLNSPPYSTPVGLSITVGVYKLPFTVV